MAKLNTRLAWEADATDHEALSMGENSPGQETFLVVDAADNTVHVVRQATQQGDEPASDAGAAPQRRAGDTPQPAGVDTPGGTPVAEGGPAQPSDEPVATPAAATTGTAGPVAAEGEGNTGAR